MSPSPSDAELIVRSRRDPAVFWQLYDRWSEDVLAYFYRRTLNPEDSADLVAETFASAYQSRGKFRDIGKPGKAWLFGVARNQLNQYWRNRKVELRAVQRLGVRVPELDDESIERIEKLVDAEAYGARLKTALHELSAKEQDAVRLRVVEEMDYSSVASALGCSEGTARVRVHRGLSRLAEILEVPS